MTLIIEFHQVNAETIEHLKKVVMLILQMLQISQKLSANFSFSNAFLLATFHWVNASTVEQGELNVWS